MLIKYYWYLLSNIYYRFLLNKLGKYSYIARPNLLIGKSNINIGDKVRVFPYCRFESVNGGLIFIDSNVSIGQNVNITSAKNVSIGKGTTISSNVYITDMEHSIADPNVSVMEQENIFTDGTFIGDNCFIGTGAVILAGARLNDSVVVGANTVVKGVIPGGGVCVGNPAKVIKNRYD
jgi:acetyltransferase-like isoleucine patch superfamily enzyme